MSGRRDDAYEVRYRLDSSRTRRRKLTLVATGLVVAAWLAATMTAPRSPELARVDPSALVPSDARDSLDTLPPRVDRFTAIGDLSIPVVAVDGLSWLETRAGTLHAGDGWSPERAFLWADGSTLCVCRSPELGAGAVEHELRTYSAVGEHTSTVFTDWPAKPGLRTITDTELDAANGRLYVAWARRSPDDRWSVGLDRWDLDDGVHLTTTVTEAALPEPVAGESVSIGLWIAPDGRRARVHFSAGPQFDQPSQLGESWDVPTDGPTLGEAERVAELDLPFGISCFAEGWGTNSQFVTVCREGFGLVAYVQPGEPVERVELTSDLVVELDWLIDQTSGRVYLWDSFLHRMTWLDAANLAFGSVEAFPGSPGAVPRQPWPAPRADRTAWLPRGMPRPGSGPDQDSIAGSPDGSIIYAAGYRLGSAPSPSKESTGIWVFDAETLGLVAHWESAGAYDALTLTPDGAYLMALAGPTAQEAIAFGNERRTIAFHDGRTGELALLLRDQMSEAVFLVAEPDPKPT